MAWYRAGSVGVTNGSKNVTGASTFWVNNVQPGDALIGPDGAYYEVDVVSGNGALTLVEAYAGTTVASGGAYKIIPTQGRVRDMAAAVLQLITDYGAVENSLTVSGGNVGIGTVPAHRLHVAGVADGRMQVEGGAGYGMVFVQGSSGSSAQLQLNSNGGTGRRFSVASLATGKFVVSDETAGADRLTIDTGGNVGIGTANPGAYEKLTVWGGNVHIQSDAAVPGVGARLILSDSNNKCFVQSMTVGAGSELAIGTDDAERIRVTGSGVGIGTVTPTAKLDVVGAGDGNLQYRTGTRTVGVGQVGGEAAIVWGSGTVLHFFSGSTKMWIDALGNFTHYAPVAPPALGSNGTMVWNLTSNTNLRVSARGDDGVTRTGNIPLS